MFAQVLAVSLLLFVKYTFTQEDCTGFSHKGTCYSSGTYINDVSATSWLDCAIPGSSGLQWVTSGGDTCEANNEYPVRCPGGSPERLRVINAGGFTDDHGGEYKCCSPSVADCRTAIVANIYDTFIPYDADIRVDARNDYHVICRIIGRRPSNDNFKIFYEDDSATGVIVDRRSCDDSGYRCAPGSGSGSVSDSVSNYRERRIRVRWTGDETTGDLFKQSVNNGDHCFTCQASIGDLVRDFNASCVTAPASAPQALSVDGCFLTWTYPDPTDADGYIVTVGLQEGVETTDTDYTVVLSDSVGPGTSWPVTVRAYQEILGPAAQTNIMVCPGACSDQCMECSTCGVCTCRAGWTGVDCCEDINECDTDNGGCNHNCTNTDGSFECSCRDGYELGDDGKTCSDINECDTDNGGCNHNCTNTDGSFECFCRDDDGYELGDDGKTCSDINECDTDNGGCSHNCTNTDGSFECSCRDGYRLRHDGKGCIDIDECHEGIDDCDEYCTNTVGSFTCSCHTEKKYFLADDGKSCTSITYAEGYPTVSDGRVVHAIVQRPEGIAEESTIKCTLVHCDVCDTVIDSTNCTYGEEFTLQGHRNRRRCVNINVTFADGRWKCDVLCLWLAEDDGCSVCLQGARIEYQRDSVILHFGPISAATELVCSADSGETFQACTGPNHHVVNDPEGDTEIVVCPVNSGGVACSVCRCGIFKFNPHFFNQESIGYANIHTCPTVSPS